MIARLRDLAAGLSFWRWDNDRRLIVLGYQRPDAPLPAFELLVTLFTGIPGMRWNGYVIVLPGLTFITLTCPRWGISLAHANGIEAVEETVR